MDTGDSRSGSPSPTEAETERDQDKPYHSKRPHRKSRLGCRNCKKRKVKCDEARPACRACLLRREVCVYPPPAKAVSGSSTSPSPERQMPLLDVSQRDPLSLLRGDSHAIISEPLFRPSDTDVTDMRLLWFYTTTTFGSFAIEAGREPIIDNLLKVKVVQYAFESPFLMDCVLGLSALHMQHLKQDVPTQKALLYRARAFERYRAAIEKADPHDYPALLACSLLLCALASHMFREPSTKDLCIVDWMVVWRGIGLIVDLVNPDSIFESGLLQLFNRPAIDLDQAARHIPNNLLFHVSSLKEGDPDHSYRDVYYETLKYIGALYQDLEHGFSPILDLRIITIFTFFPRDFVELARQRRPLTLVFLAHYLAFAKLLDHVWWMEGISDREIRIIGRIVGEEYRHLLRIPLMAVNVHDKVELARLLLENPAWEPPAEDLYNVYRDPRVKKLTLVDDDGQEVDYVGTWVKRISLTADSPPQPAKSNV